MDFTNVFHKHEKQFNKYLQKEKISFLKKIERQFSSNCNRNSFDFKQTIAMGRFSNVFLVSHKKSDEIIALKIIRKDFLVRNNLVLHSKNEIKISYAIKFEFLINLSYYFTDNMYIYLGFPYISGGDLFLALSTHQKFNETLGIFYSSQILLALEYLHYMGVIYRDVKPENILILHDGYIKLTDYGFSKKIDHNRTYTFCGTVEYLAPEIVLLKSYDYTTDWWSFGVIIYEMIAGVTPFFNENPEILIKNICECKYIIPKDFSSELKHLIQNMVVSDKSKRLGCVHNGVRHIKSHRWYINLNWDDVLNKRMKPPSLISSVTDPRDTSAAENLPLIELESASQDIFAKHFTEF